MPNSRLDAVRVWLTRTFAGRLLIAGVALKLVAWVGLLTQRGPGLFGAIDTLGGLSILVSALAIGYRVYALARHRLLWRVRRKLILSYVFIGVVPVLLVVIFFTLGGLLFFFNVSAFMLRNHVASVVEGAQFLAQLFAGGDAHVVKEIGALARPDDIRFTESMPKTRSGKIMRRLLRDIAAGRESTGDTSTLEDLGVMARLREEDEA